MTILWFIVGGFVLYAVAFYLWLWRTAGPDEWDAAGRGEGEDGC